CASFVSASCLMSMRFHCFGPEAVHTLSSCESLRNHGAAAHSHGPSCGIGDESVHSRFQHCLYEPPWTAATTGSDDSPVTSGFSSFGYFTLYIDQPFGAIPSKSGTDATS